MSLVKLADYLWFKYAADEAEEEAPPTQRDMPDTSFGVPINPIKVRILKDRLINQYDKIAQHITQLPEYQWINQTLSGQPHWKAFQDGIAMLAENILALPLKDGFSYAMQMIKALNQVRSDLRLHPMPKSHKERLDLAIKGIQDSMWEESKRFLNIHDLRGIELEYPELKGILGKVKPTWDYGSGRNPTRKPLGKRYRGETVEEMIARLEKENEEEELSKKK